MARDVSTFSMLSEPRNRDADNFTYTCNSCKTHVETRYHCIVCDDFDLCAPCHEKDIHPHNMEKLGLGIEVGAATGDMKQVNPQEVRKLLIQQCIQSLEHACQCHDVNCLIPSCQKMKRVVIHSKICKREIKSDCPICKQLLALCCFHADHCKDTKCSVWFCSRMKQKLNEVPGLQLRMAAMRLASPSAPLSPVLASPTASPAHTSILGSPSTSLEPALTLALASSTPSSTLTSPSISPAPASTSTSTSTSSAPASALASPSTSPAPTSTSPATSPAPISILASPSTSPTLVSTLASPALPFPLASPALTSPPTSKQ